MDTPLCQYYTRCRCYACGLLACPRCSRIVKWYGKRHRICETCLEDADMKTVTDLAVERGQLVRCAWEEE